MQSCTYSVQLYQPLPSKSLQSRVPVSHAYIHYKANLDKSQLTATQAKGEHADSMQIVTWSGFVARDPMLQARSINN